MNGDYDLPQRSSSPLKRRASSMDPGVDPSIKGDGGSANIDQGLPRAMSIDPPEPLGSTKEVQPSSKSSVPPLDDSHVKSNPRVLFFFFN